MVPQMKDLIVEKKKWLEEDDLIEIIAISESTPGPIAINMATFIGYKQRKVLGSLFATLGVILPSLIIIFVISLFFDKFIENEYVSMAFVGIKACVAFLILKAGINMLKKIKRKVFPICMFIAVLSLIIIFELFAIHFSAIFYILIGGLIGIFINCFVKCKEEII